MNTTEAGQVFFNIFKKDFDLRRLSILRSLKSAEIYENFNDNQNFVDQTHSRDYPVEMSLLILFLIAAMCTLLSIVRFRR